MVQSYEKPPMDWELKAAFEKVSFPAISEITPEIYQMMRTATTTPATFLEELKARGISHKEIKISSTDNSNHEITLSILQRTSEDSKLRPCIYWMHGGGLHWGDRLNTLEAPIDMILECDAICVTVEYRLAPEARFSTSLEDCYAGLQWTTKHSQQLGIDPKLLMIGGTSAGGLLAASVALLCRDRQGPAICAQFLVCPGLDDRLETVSSRQYVESSDFIPTGVMAQMWKGSLRESHEGPSLGSVPPGRMEDLSNLPTAFLDVGSAEVFRDEVVAYASKLWASGVQAELHVWAGAFHGSDMFLRDAAVSKAAIKAKLSWAKRIFGTEGYSQSSVGL